MDGYLVKGHILLRPHTGVSLFAHNIPFRLCVGVECLRLPHGFVVDEIWLDDAIARHQEADTFLS